MRYVVAMPGFMLLFSFSSLLMASVSSHHHHPRDHSFNTWKSQKPVHGKSKQSCPRTTPAVYRRRRSASVITGTWQDGDRKHLPLSLLLRATCWPLYLCLNHYCFCWLRRHAMLSLRTQVEFLTSRIIPKWGIGTEKSSSRKKTGSVTSFWMDHLPLVWDLWTHLI